MICVSVLQITSLVHLFNFSSAVNSLFASFGITETDSAALKLRKATQSVKLDGTSLRMATSYFSGISAQVVGFFYYLFFQFYCRLKV